MLFNPPSNLETSYYYYCVSLILINFYLHLHHLHPYLLRSLLTAFFFFLILAALGLLAASGLLEFQ